MVRDFLLHIEGNDIILMIGDKETPQILLKNFFNMKHSAARNVIERCFGLLKLRWAILMGNSFYPVKTHYKIIVACCLLHNLIRKEMLVDLVEALFVESSARMDFGPSEPSSGRGKNKRGWTPVEDAILVEIMLDLVVLGKIKCDNAQSMEKLVACLPEPSLPPPSPPVDKMSKVFEEVSKISNFNESDMLDVSEIIMKDPAKVNLLFSIPENLKKTWMDKLLNS
ncbi:hypothetical protein L1049_008863 [Liquidambar formosana]|uniref:DDE Tnp4 domain-containing protein n=1 Tax=Liquidambar formosana TaxID=63359 RepID=A0AAP0SBD6_LIQFO